MAVARHRVRSRRWPLRLRPAAIIALTCLVMVVVAGAALGGARLLTGGARNPSASAGDRPSVTAARSGAPSPDASAGSGRTASPHPSASPDHSASPAAGASPATSAPSSPAPAPSLPADASAAASVLALINQARAQAGLPAYTILDGLDLSASRHDQLMADGCGLSHQCPGEASLGARETAAGVQWTAAGENIGEGGPVADTTAAITQMAVTLTQDMLNEKPPDDGHRLNLLSSTFTHVGIAIIWSSNGTVWMTQDFAN